VANTVGFLKGKSAIRIHREYLAKKRNFTGFHFCLRSPNHGTPQEGSYFKRAGPSWRTRGRRLQVTLESTPSRPSKLSTRILWEYGSTVRKADSWAHHSAPWTGSQ
jgi:hypothetical protein